VRRRGSRFASAACPAWWSDDGSPVAKVIRRLSANATPEPAAALTPARLGDMKVQRRRPPHGLVSWEPMISRLQ